MIRVFSWLLVRPLRREPVRNGLTLAAVALGVAVALAITLAGDSATGSFTASVESLSGRAGYLITGTGGIDESLLGTLETLPFPYTFSPRIEDYAFVNGEGSAIPLIGVDMVSGSSSSGILVTPATGLRKGQTVRLLIGDQYRTFQVGGVVAHQSQTPAFVLDIGQAQRITNKTGRLDSIAVSVPAGISLVPIRNVLPPGVTLEPSGSRKKQNQKMMTAFRTNLRVLSYVALLVGAFLIYNAISISVVRRRTEVGIVRALGATRNAVLTAFLLESTLFGLIGAGIGIFAGRIIASAAVRAMAETVSTLYVSSRPGPIQLTLSISLLCVGAAIAMALLAGLVPALEAAAVAPVQAMARGREEFVARMRFARAPYAGLIAFAGAAALMWLAPYVAVLLVVAAVCCFLPGAVGVTARIFRRTRIPELLVAVRSLQSSVGRTVVVTAALTIATGMTAAIGIMVGSFRETVVTWLDQDLRADFYLRPAGQPGADRFPVMDATLADEIEKIPGVVWVDRYRAYPITVDGAPALFAGGEAAKASIRLLSGDTRRVLRQLRQGNFAVVSEPYANKHHVHAGDLITIPLAGAERRFRVLGLYYDYSSERGSVVVDRKTLLKYLPDKALSSLAVRVSPGSHVQRQIEHVIGGRAVLVFANSELRERALATFDQTFRITYALEGIAVVVAILGIASSLLAVIIDRRREFAIVRFVGGLQSQVRRMVLYEAAVISGIASLAGLILGVLLSLILVFVINKQAFGWTLQFHVPVLFLLATLGLIFAATIVAALYPAREAVRLDPIEGVHAE